MLLVAVVAAAVLGAAPEARWTEAALAAKPLWATIKTNQGTLVVRLYTDTAPKTVANFVGLATGEREWTDPATEQPTRRRLYDGVVFHRVMPNFMIQGGDPTGTGRGGPGYQFPDELSKQRTFSRPGLLAMANRGANTNGSQFFITVAPTPHLDGKHTLFGEVVQGYEVAVAISKVPRDGKNRPLGDVEIATIEVSDQGPRLPVTVPPGVKLAPPPPKRPADAPTQ